MKRILKKEFLANFFTFYDKKQVKNIYINDYRH